MRVYFVTIPRAPSPRWLDDEDDGPSVLSLVLRRTSDTLASSLELRANRLRADEVTVEEVIVEIRKQIAACAIDDPIGAGDLSELMLELVRVRENAIRPFDSPT